MTIPAGQLQGELHHLPRSLLRLHVALELVGGETLAARVKRGALPIEEALELCKQIAEALEVAHGKGIIHRDLKPANVILTPDGKVKVLDFGLAKTDGTVSSTADPADSMSPTITDDFTIPGTLLGTAAYMSPEQARGKPIDKRTDIWSFGCVLYECLTGTRIFKGEDTSHTLAKIIEGEPDWTALPENTPPTIHLLLRKQISSRSTGLVSPMQKYLTLWLLPPGGVSSPSYRMRWAQIQTLCWAT